MIVSQFCVPSLLVLILFLLDGAASVRVTRQAVVVSNIINPCACAHTCNYCIARVYLLERGQAARAKF